MRFFALFVVFAILIVARFAGAQFNGDGVMVPVKKASITLAAPISFSPASVTVADNCCAAAGTTLAVIAVTMSDGSTFAGQCYDTDPNGLTQILPSTGGCTLQSKIAYSSANDGTYSNITLNFCNGGTNCLNPSSANFTLSINPSTIPAAALAGCTLYGSSSGSCFSTMAVDYDFSGATSCVGSGCAFPGQATNYYQTLSNWLDCQGASTPQWYLSVGNCTPYSIVTDGSAQVLKVGWVAADLSSFDQASIYTAQHNSAGTGTDFPVGFYYEAVIRTDAASDSANSGCSCIINDVWSYTGPGNGTPVNEWDFMEQYSTGFDNTGQNMGIPCCYMDGNIFVPPSGYNHEVYNTYGERITQDGRQGTEVCNYLNGTQISCNLFAQSNGYSFVANPNLSTPLALLMTAGPQFTTPSPVPSVSNLYVKSIKVWTCSGWKVALPPTLNGAACAGGLVATNP